LGNFSCDPQRKLPREHRTFLDVDRDNFHEVLRQIGPSLTLDMSGVLPDHPEGLSVRLEFRSLADFGPTAAALEVQPMAAMFARRAALLGEGRDVAEIEGRIYRLWEAIVQAPEFQRLEAAWRGLHLLVTNAETGVMLKIKVLDISKEELTEDLAQAGGTNRSRLFQQVYEDPLATPSGEPFAALIGDYEFSHQPDDVALLEKMSQLGSMAFCPFIAAASPRLCGINGWDELDPVGDRQAVASGPEYARWNTLRTGEAARFVYLTVPRVAARLPCLTLAEQARNLGFQEIEPGENPVAGLAPSNVYCWTNSAYVVGMRLADSFARAGHCMAVWKSDGGTIEGLVGGNLTGDQNDLDRVSRVEVGVTREVGLTGEQVDRLLFLGLAPLWDPKDAGRAMPGGPPSIQRVAGDLAKEQVSDAFLTGRLQYVMAVSRLAHYLMLIARDGFAKSVPWEQCQESLRRWIAPCVDSCGPPTPKMAAKILLREARIIIRPKAETPEQGQIVAWLQPWLPDLQLNRPQRITMHIPRFSK
jgi:type VI secretion system protein ImpC